MSVIVIKKLWYEYSTPVMIKKAYNDYLKFSLRFISSVMERKKYIIITNS